MRRFVILLCLVVPAVAHLGRAQPLASADEVGVRKAVTDLVEAWNRHDVPAMVALHTPGVNFTNIAGQWLQGREQVSTTLARVHGSVFAKSSMTLSIAQVRFLGDNVAVVHGSMELHGVPPDAQGECTYMRVLVRQGGRWLIDDFQNTLIRPPAPPSIPR